MLTYALDDAPARARLEDFPVALAAALADKMAAQLAAVAQTAGANLSGGVLTPRSGALLASLDPQLKIDGALLIASLGAGGDLPYAAIQEYGGATSPHDIIPTKAKALSFMLGGKRIFAARAHHPGSRIPARSYLRSALEAAGDDVVGSLADALVEAAGA